MPVVMSDHDVRGHFQILLRICRSAPWREVWDQLGIGVESFESLGIPNDAPDRDVWMACQRNETILITGNRNAKGVDSLELVIAELGDSRSLPIFTISQPQRVYTNREYAELVAVKMMEYLIDIESLRGIGRLYLP